MIAVDTSALVAILLRTPEGPACSAAMAAADRLIISAGTMAEAMIVAERKNILGDMLAMFYLMPFEPVEVTAAGARKVADACARWGKGAHPARLNFGDCFSYEAAKSHDCPLLYIGADFAQTDIRSALARAGSA